MKWSMAGRCLSVLVLLMFLGWESWIGRLSSDACCCSSGSKPSCHCQGAVSSCSLECVTSGLQAVLDNPASSEEIWVGWAASPRQDTPARQERLSATGITPNLACSQAMSRCPLLLQSELNLPPPFLCLV